MYNKTIIEFGFCDIPPASADYTCLDLDYSGYHKSRIQLLFIIRLMCMYYEERWAGTCLELN